MGEQRVVHAIFFEEETPRLDPVALRAFGDHADIAAGAEAATFGMIDQHRLDREIAAPRSEEHTYELQSLMRISYAAFRLKKKKYKLNKNKRLQTTTST